MLECRHECDLYCPFLLPLEAKKQKKRIRKKRRMNHGLVRVGACRSNHCCCILVPGEGCQGRVAGGPLVLVGSSKEDGDFNPGLLFLGCIHSLIPLFGAGC